jgi:hypothetical protein
MQQTPSMSLHPQTTTRRTLAIILAIIGTVLVWLPIIAPLFFSLLYLARTGRWRLDYLMPAELGLLVAVGACALVAAALLARSRLKLIGGAIALAIGMLVGGQALAVATGLASGETEPVGWCWSSGRWPAIRCQSCDGHGGVAAARSVQASPAARRSAES